MFYIQCTFVADIWRIKWADWNALFAQSALCTCIPYWQYNRIDKNSENKYVTLDEADFIQSA